MVTTTDKTIDEKIIARHDASVQARAKVEIAVVRRLVTDFLKAGHKVTVDGERGFDDEGRLLASDDVNRIVDECFGLDECHLFIHYAGQTQFIDGQGRIECMGWVFLVMGNDGWDIISDYTTNMEFIAGPVCDWATKRFCK